MTLLTSTASFANSDVVGQFEAIVDKFNSNVSSYPPKISPPNQYVEEWYLREIYLINVEYDVKQTDSLISPYHGEIIFQCSVKGSKGSSKAEVSNGTITFDTGNQASPCIAKYAYQKNKWVLKQAICKTDSGGWEEPIEGVETWCISVLPKPD